MQEENTHSKKMVWIIAGLALVVLTVAGMWTLNNNKPQVQQQQTTEEAETAQSAPVAPAEAQIEITSNGFVPASLNVTPGTRVVWTNATGAADRIVSTGTNKLSNLGAQEVPPQDSYVFTFDQPGDFTFTSQNNPAMQGAVHVE